MTEEDFFRIYTSESTKIIVEILSRQNVLTLQNLKSKCRPGWLRTHIIDAINRKLSGV